MKVLKTVPCCVVAFAIIVRLSACTDPTQKKLDKAHKETEIAMRAAKEAQRRYDELLEAYDEYKQTQGKLDYN